MASISNVLQHQYEGFEKDGGLKEMFSEHSRPAKAEATRKLMNTKMQEGTLFLAHFKLNVNMNKIVLTLPELLNQFQTAKGILHSKKASGSVNLAEDSKRKPK
ncbi:uncharacterized protein LOC113272235 [Papaver somniferum]|uniref:uncharacterized protein LOC113272235 n=1 Tax=Papaver somniferum TaxID=3469 RepID=UPI000E703D01|nr:uncharacterized protein LOC113272235 [Papaver somniferum]